MLEPRFIETIAQEESLQPEQVAAIVELLESGDSLPFLARYRKDAIGGLEEKRLEAIADRKRYFAGVSQRRKALVESLAQKAVLTDEVREAIEAAGDKTALDDIQAPFKTKRRNKSTAAEEQGLAPLADFILQQLPGIQNVEEYAAAFVKPEKSISDPQEALEGARYILAERLAYDCQMRAAIREHMWTEGSLISKSTKNAQGKKTKYEAYYDFAEPVNKVPSHRMLAILRGVKEGFLRIDISVDDMKILDALFAMLVKDLESVFAPQIRQALNEAYTRHLRPTIENDVLGAMRRHAEADAIRVFRENAENLYLAPPAGAINAIGIACGRKGFSLAIIDGTGQVLETCEMVTARAAAAKAAANPPAPAAAAPAEAGAEQDKAPSSPEEAPSPEEASSSAEAAPAGEAALVAEAAPASQPAEAPAPAAATAPEAAKASGPPPLQFGSEEAKAALLNLMEKHDVRGVAISNGSGARDMARFVKSVLIALRKRGTFAVIVNEGGVSTYASSRLAREELPGLKADMRAAIFVARRLQDPLRELVKVEPRSVGVGQYQHDVTQKDLREGLARTVVSCVNRAGVDVNAASEAMLKNISGISDALAKHLIETRAKLGAFKSRDQLLTIDGVGPKVFEQCAGFLRILNGDNPLDATWLHPEQYALVEKMAESIGKPVAEIIGNAEVIKTIDFKAFADGAVGPLTLESIRNELANPGQDPRRSFRAPRLAEGVTSIDDIKEDMEMEGVVTNVTDFGAFVDIGLEQDGLVHLSELSRRFVQDPRDVVKVGYVVRVKVIKVDKNIPRISLSMKAATPPPRRKPGQRPRPRPGDGSQEAGDSAPRGQRDDRRRSQEDGGRPRGRRGRDDASGRGSSREGSGKTGRRQARQSRHAKPSGPKVSKHGKDQGPFNSAFADKLADLKDKLGS